MEIEIILLMVEMKEFRKRSCPVMDYRGGDWLQYIERGATHL